MSRANNPQLKSWVDVKPGSDFPIQSLPFGIFETNNRTARAGVAIGEYILDLQVLFEEKILDRVPWPFKTNVFAEETLNNFIALGKPTTNACLLYTS